MESDQPPHTFSTNTTLGVDDQIDHAHPPTDLSAPSAPSAHTSLHMFEGSTNFEIKDSILTNAQGNVNIYKFDIGAPLSDEFKTLFIQHVAGSITVKDLDKIKEKMEQYALSQVIRDHLPRVSAAYSDYTSGNLRRVTCFEGTREALLEEIGQWLTSLDGPRAYLLFGIAGIGKSTVIQTVAERANNFRLLGASFFFSRDEVERNNAKHFFTTIAFQLCLYNKEFAQAIEKSLLTERGLDAITKDPITQLETLILEPLRGNSRLLPTVIAVDALDECDDRDAPIVLAALNRLVQELPCFKVILTTRPQPHLPPVPNVHRVFHLQDIEGKVVEGDIRLYLEHNLSRENISKIFPKLRKQWGANSQDVDAILRAAGRLFIIASTALRFVLNPRFGDPEHRMKGLRDEIDREQLSFKDLNRFYTIILRIAINEDSDSDTKQRYQDTVGTIILVQDPLPIETLRCLIGSWSADAIETLLGDLQSVIYVKDDMPRIYHRSFSDFVTNCKDDDLRIIPRKHHTRLATRCFEIMNSYLRQNILDLGTPSRFMNNDAGLAADKISAEHLAEKIPGELRYACVHWASHVEGADPDDAILLREVDIFVNKHLLHWLEVLSLINKLEMATYALRVLITSMKLGSSNTHGVVSDALLFTPKFYERIRRSALHAYYSALPFTPTESLLLKSHSEETIHCLCRPEGIPAHWDSLIAQISWLGIVVDPVHIIFSNDSSKFAMCRRQEIRLFNAENGTLIRSFKGDRMSIACDFSAVAVLQGSAVTLWSVAGDTPIAMVRQSEEIVKLALSFDGSRLAVGLSNGTVDLWDAWKGELITNLVGYGGHGGQLGFAPSGYRFAFMSGDGSVQLYDGHDGKLVAELDCKSKKHVKFVLSHDGNHLASLVKEDEKYSLALWGGERGCLIDVTEDVGDGLAISEDGSFIATGGLSRQKSVQLWRGNHLALIDTLDDWQWVERLAISRGVLAIGRFRTLSLYDIANHAFIVTLQHVYPQSLGLSPDCTRLVVGKGSRFLLYDVQSLRAFTPTSRQQISSRVSTLAFSPDSTRLASGLTDGTVQLWDTADTKQPMATHKLHSGQVNTVTFSLDGGQFASGSDDKSARLWNGKDGAPKALQCWVDGRVRSVAFSHIILAVATDSRITLFDRESLHVVDTLLNGGCCSFSVDGSFVASACNQDPRTSDVTVWKVEGLIKTATFKVNSAIDMLAFSPDGSQLAAQSTCHDGSFRFFDVVNKKTIEITGHEDLHWIPNFMNGVLISWRQDRTHGDCLLGRFFGHPAWVPILWIPREFDIFCFAVSSSMVALGCVDGRILFVRF